MPKYAAAHPGKIGDALYSLPFIRYMYRTTGITFDFYTSEYCRPIKELFEHQDCIDRVIIAEDYKLENFGCGAQPWYINIPVGYDRIFQLGFQRTPDQMLHQFIAAEQGVYEPLAIEYQCPPIQSYSIGSILFKENNLPYICIAPKGESSFGAFFDKLVEDVSQYFGCVTLGGKGDYRNNNSADCTGKSLLETASIIANSRGFVGLMSSQLALANGFPISRIALGGYDSDMRHAVKYHLNYYPTHPTTEEILRLCK